MTMSGEDAFVRGRSATICDVTDFDDALRDARAELVDRTTRQAPARQRQHQVGDRLHSLIRTTAARSFSALAASGAEVFTVVNESTLDQPFAIAGVILESVWDEGAAIAIVGESGELADKFMTGRNTHLVRRKSKFFGGSRDATISGRRVLAADLRTPSITAWIKDVNKSEPGETLVTFAPEDMPPSLPWRLQFHTRADDYGHAEQQLADQIVATFARLTAKRLEDLSAEGNS